jgi:arylsulfatase A-like enzyme
VLRLADQDADHRPFGRRWIALHRLPHDGHVLNDASGPVDWLQCHRGKIANEAGTIAEVLQTVGYRNYIAHGWDEERQRRIVRQKAMGIVPEATRLPPRNPGVQAWTEYTADERQFFTRLHSAFAAMLDHADLHLARAIAFLEKTGQRENIIVLVLSDNGATQEAAVSGVNLMGPFNLRPEPMAEKIAHRGYWRPQLPLQLSPRVGDGVQHAATPIQAEYPRGWHPPRVISRLKGIAARGELRHQFAHVCDLLPTLLELLNVDRPDEIQGIRQMPNEGTSFAASFKDPKAPSKPGLQYFEMFGHRGLWHQGWKAVAYHPIGTRYEDDK